MSACAIVNVLILVLSLRKISPQKEGDLRLVSGSPLGGRLEIYLNRNWSSICSSGFDFYEGDIGCTQLHFLYSSAVGTTQTLNYSTGHGTKVLNGLECSASDRKLIHCFISSDSCLDSTHEVAVECSNKSSALRLVSDSGRTEGLSSGRLEILINNNWGTICSTDFSQVEADVACIQMEYERANGYTQTSAVGYQDSLNKPIWLDRLNCSTTSFSKYNLRLCLHMGTGIINCTHKDDIFLSCTSPGSIRLWSADNSALTTSGQLQMYWNGQWLPICSYPYFSGNSALVACRQLGFEKVVGYRMERHNERRFLLSEINCLSSYEPTLLNCSHGLIGSPHPECGKSATSIFLFCEAINTTLSIIPSGGHTLAFPTKGLLGGTIVFLSICAVVYALFKYRKRYIPLFIKKK